jgi:uncharacterized protein (DUF433 family)
MDTLDRITIDPKVCLGQPTIRRMRITVGVILKMLAAGRSVQDVLEAYPELVEEDVRQAMLYAASRRGFPDLTSFRESLGTPTYPGNTIQEMREDERG